MTFFFPYREFINNLQISNTFYFITDDTRFGK